MIPLTGGLELGLRLVALVSTYLVHGVLWAAVVALLTRGGRVPASASSSMWRMALFGPLLTTILSATLQRGLDQQHDASSLVLSPSLHEVTVPTLPSATVAVRVGGAVDAQWLGENVWRWFVLAWTAALLLGLARFARAAWQVSRTLRRSRPSTDERSQRLLESLLSQTRLKRVRLMECHETTSPFSVGLSAICMPSRLLDGMSESEVEAVLAHELAHLERRDGLWFPAVAFVEAVSWMYPLNRWVSSRARYCAELACDDRAVALTKKPCALAHALAYVAERAFERQRCALVPSMADSSGALLGRVKRLVVADAGRGSQPSTGKSRWAVACVAVTGCSLSAVRLDLPEGETPRAPAPGEVAAPAAVKRRPGPAVDRGAIELELAALEVREREVQAELDSMFSESQLASTGSTARQLELEQELRHSHEMRAFLAAALSEPNAAREPVSR